MRPFFTIINCNRPGIVDLPSNTGAENADAITLPEIFHDFENAVADMGYVEIIIYILTSPIFFMVEHLILKPNSLSTQAVFPK